MSPFVRPFLLLALLAAVPAANAATLIYTNDVLGEIEPCGCRSNPQGGMIRKQGLLDKLEDKEILQLDAGDLLFATSNLPPVLARQAEAQAGFLLKSMDLTHHDAVVPGEKDLALGLKVFESARKKSKIKWLAANIRKRNGGRLFEPHAIYTRTGADGKKLKIAVFGIAGETLPWSPDVKVSSALAAAKAEVKALRKKADVLIALTHQGYEADLALAKAVKGIDIIVGGHSQTFIQSPTQTNGTTIYQSSFRNQYVGVVPLVAPFKGEGHRLVGLDESYELKEGAQVTLVKEFKAAIADMNSKEDALAQKAAEKDGSLASGKKFQTFPRCAECHLKQFEFWRKTQHALALSPLFHAQQAKNKECLQCHTVGLGDKDGFTNVNALAERKKPPRVVPLTGDSDSEAAATSSSSTSAAASEETVDDKAVEPVATEDLVEYLKSLHDAKSLKDEVKIVRADKDGVSLHRSLSSLTSSWTPVQCENCHQPGRDHPFTGGYAKKVEKTVCLQCHTAARAPEWYTKDGQPDWEKIAQKRVTITCPAGELPEEEN